MPYRVVTIARAIGAHGEEIGGAVASALGFRHVDDEIIVRAAAKAGASADAVERVEQRKPMLTRMLEALAAAPPPEGFGGWDPTVFEPPTRSAAYQAFITDVIKETANEGNVVIVAHGAGVPLAGTPDVLRVFVTASAAVRAERLAGMAKLDAAKAAAAVRESDKSRADFLHRFYGLREEAPTTYDVVINTDALGIDQAAALIVAAARQTAAK